MIKIIDAKGKPCPMPVIMAKKEVDAGNTSFGIEVDNAIAIENLKKLANNCGLQISVEGKDGIFKATFTDGCVECQDILNKLEGKKELGDWCIFVGNNIIGNGDEELGVSLMKMFFYTLVESDDLPKHILFMNNGVKVPTLSKQAAEHLKELEEKGVQVMSCGACLNYYGLEEQLLAGKISNMYEITEVMKKASKVMTI